MRRVQGALTRLLQNARGALLEFLQPPLFPRTAVRPLFRRSDASLAAAETGEALGQRFLPCALVIIVVIVVINVIFIIVTSIVILLRLILW